MTEPIEDISSLPGRKVADQEDNPIGEVKEIYAMDDGFPMWVAVELSAGLADTRVVIVPLARLKEEDGDLRVPYSKARIGEAPEVENGDGISEECDHKLRGFYGIGTGDQEMWSDNKGYATLVAEEGGAAKRADDAGQLETPNADRRTDESRERLRDPGSSEMRQVTADDVMDEDEGKSENKDKDQDD
jgi:hypothetical protein